MNISKRIAIDLTGIIIDCLLSNDNGLSTNVSCLCKRHVSNLIGLLKNVYRNINVKNVEMYKINQIDLRERKRLFYFIRDLSLQYLHYTKYIDT